MMFSHPTFTFEIALTKPQNHSMAITRTSRARRCFSFLGVLSVHHPAPLQKPKTEIGNLARPQLPPSPPLSQSSQKFPIAGINLATQQLPHEVAHHTLIALPSRSRQFLGGPAADAMRSMRTLNKMWTLISFHSILSAFPI